MKSINGAKKGVGGWRRVEQYRNAAKRGEYYFH